MDPQPPQQGDVATNSSSTPNESDMFTTLHHLVSRIDAENRVDEVVEKVRGLNHEETQLLVNCLSLALEKNAVPLRNRPFVWRSLIRIASSAKVFAQNRKISPQYVDSGDESSPDVYSISGEPSTRVKVLRQAKNDTQALYSESLISWIHLSHPNVIPLYAVFFENENRLCFVSPCVTSGNICDYAREHRQVPCMPLIFDTVKALGYIHQLDIAHGGLSPQTVLVTYDGRVLITDLETDSETSHSYSQASVRYSAPELFGEDDVRPTKAADMWSFACICYEVLCGKIPFYQITNDFRISGAIANGAKPKRPDQNGAGGNEISDAMWELLLVCWERVPEDRPTCLKVYQILSGMDIRDDRVEAGQMIRAEVFEGSTVDLERATVDLGHVLGSNQPSSFRVPENLRKLLFGLIPSTTKLNMTTIAVKKFSPGDLQCFVDFLDLVLEGFTNDWDRSERRATRTLLSSLTMSTRIIPQRYKVNSIQYDSQAPIAESQFGKAYKARGPSVQINVVTNSDLVSRLLKRSPDWFHSSHPNVIPFHGIFYEGSNDLPQFCLVTPLWNKGNLREYACTLPQKSRIPLIFDVINGLVYLHEKRNMVYGGLPITPENVLISDEGRAVLLKFNTSLLSRKTLNSPEVYDLRFAAPDVGNYHSDDVWSFGCVCYEVLSRRPPYHEYTEAAQIKSAVSRGKLPQRPNHTDNSDIDEIDDQAWDLIMQCCELDRDDRPESSEIQKLIAGWGIEDTRPEAKSLRTTDMLALRSLPDIDFPRTETLLDRIQVELLQDPLSKLIQSRIKDVAAAAIGLKANDIQTLVDFLDLALKDHITISNERNRVLALLSKVTSSTRVFPQRYEVKGIKYTSQPIAEGGFGTVHKGLDHKICVKVMTRVDPPALTEWIKELILWTHASHPNVLPFYGVFLENAGDSQRICLVSPFMKNGNLNDYAPHLPQNSRLPLILDTFNGIQYIHGLGIIHSDLKGQNVLISDEGRGLITDFGASHIVTATAAATASSVQSTLRFAAPELMQDGAQPSKECDVWSFGCLCYQVLSRKVPYYQYTRDFQVVAALSRKELPKRPGPVERDNSDEDDWDEDEDWDTIDDQAWDLITKCCTPEPKDRLKIPAIKELITDMKIRDDRPAVKGIPGANVFKLNLTPEINLNRAGEILDQLQTEVDPASDSDPEVSFTDLWNSLW